MVGIRYATRIACGIQGRLMRGKPPLFRFAHRAGTRRTAMSDMIGDIILGWLLLAAVALTKAVCG